MSPDTLHVGIATLDLSVVYIHGYWVFPERLYPAWLIPELIQVVQIFHRIQFHRYTCLRLVKNKPYVQTREIL